METIYWTFFHEGDARFLIAATERGLCYSAVVDDEMTKFTAWVEKKFKQAQLIEDASKLQSYYDAFALYIRGEQHDFHFPIDVEGRGTVFQQQVWKALQEIPYGEVVNYQQIAQRIGKPAAVRAVGGAIGANPLMIVIPCHRVLGKNGKLTGFNSGLPMKELLLTVEKKHAAH